MSWSRSWSHPRFDWPTPHHLQHYTTPPSTQHHLLSDTTLYQTTPYHTLHHATLPPTSHPTAYHAPPNTKHQHTSPKPTTLHHTTPHRHPDYTWYHPTHYTTLHPTPHKATSHTTPRGKNPGFMLLRWCDVMRCPHVMLTSRHHFITFVALLNAVIYFTLQYMQVWTRITLQKYMIRYRMSEGELSGWWDLCPMPSR